VEYTDDEYASIEVRSLPGTVGFDTMSKPGRPGNGFIMLGAIGALVMPLLIGIPLIGVAFWRVAGHKHHAWLGVAIALVSVGVGWLLRVGSGIPLL
jgi:hypothetical protein